MTGGTKLRLALAAFGLLLVIGAIVAVATEAGLQSLWRAAQVFLPSGLRVQSVQGRLIGPLTVRGLALTTDALQLAVEEVRLEWQPSRLLLGTVHVDSILVAGLAYVDMGENGAPPSPSAEPQQLPERLGLPVAVRLDELQVQDVTVRPTANGEPFVVNSAELRAHYDRHQLVIDKLEAHGPLFDLRGRSKFGAKLPYPIDGEYQWQLRLPDLAPLSARTVLGGDLHELRLVQELAPPYQLEAHATLTDVVSARQLRLDLVIGKAALSAIRADLPPLLLSGKLSAHGKPDDIVASGRLQTEHPELGELRAEVVAQYARDTLTLQQLRLTSPESAMEIAARGEIALAADAPMLDMEASWARLRWPLNGEAMVTSARGRARATGTLTELVSEFDFQLAEKGRVQGGAMRAGEQLEAEINWSDLQWPESDPQMVSPSGKLQVSGSLDEYRVELAGEITSPGRPDARLEVKGDGDLEGFTLSQLQAKTLGGVIMAHGAVQWRPALAGEITLEGEGLDPAGLLVEWPGKLDARLHAAAETKAGALAAQVRDLSVRGTLRGLPFQLSAAGHYHAAQLELRTLALASGPSRLSASGRVGNELDLVWELNSPDLATLAPQAQGALAGQGKVSGPRSSPRVTAALAGSALRYQAYTLREINLEADVDLAGAARSHLALTMSDGRAEDLLIESISLGGTGYPGSHELELTAVTNQGKGTIELAGRFADARWGFELKQADVAPTGLGSWSLVSPASGFVTAQDVNVSRACWRSADAALCVLGERSSQGLSAQVDLEKFPLPTLAERMPAELGLEGDLEAHLSVRQLPGESPQGRLRLATTDGRLFTEEPGETVTLLAFQPIKLTVELTPAGLDFVGSIPLESGSGIEFEAEIAGTEGPFSERGMEARVRGEIADLGFITALAPEVQRIDGQLQLDVQLGGTPGAPVLKGGSVLELGALTLATPAIELQDIRVELSGPGTGDIAIDAHARSGGGQLRLQGKANLVAETKAELALTGADFLVMDTPEAQVYLSPDLRLALEGNRIDLQGEVRVPKADIQLKKLPEGAVSASNDQVIVKQEEEATPMERYLLHARVRLILGDAVSFLGFGLEARIAGNVLAVDVPGQLTTASGELALVGGQYRAFGQELEIQRGRLLFAGGAVGDPGLDVRAVRRPEAGVLVGVNVRGTLREPKLTVFSEPAMSKKEQLSYLILGRSPEGTTTAEQTAMEQTAMAVGMMGAGIGSLVGLDDVGVERGGGGGAEKSLLVVGKYLSPKLYVGYGIGIFEPISTLRLRYTLTRHWKIQTESSAETSGADLFYVIERGR